MLIFNCTYLLRRTGTWMMTGNGVMHNGITVMDDYGINLDRLQVIFFLIIHLVVILSFIVY